jgi:DNA repair protein RadC
MTDEKPTYRITDPAESDRPRERLAQFGSNFLNSAELLAILLRVGVPGENAVQVGYRLLNAFGWLPGLHRADFDELCEQYGIGVAKAATINSPKDAADLVQYQMSALEQEELWVLLLNTRNRVLRIVPIYRGSVNSSQVRVGELFKDAIRRNAAAIIVVHNHPSGDPTPSPDDVAITRAVVEAGKLLEIQVLDHLVIGHGRFISLKERGLGFG